MVSIKVIQAWTIGASDPVAVQKIIDEFPIIRTKLDHPENEFIEWALFCEWVARMRTIIKTPQEWEVIGANSMKLPIFEYIKDITTLAGGMELVYWMGMHWILPAMIPLIRVENYHQHQDGMIEFTLAFDSRVEAVPEVFYSEVGVFRITPTLYFNLPEAEVRMEITGDKARYWIQPPMKKDFINRIKKTFTKVIPMKALTMEFMNLHRQMLEYYNNSEEKEKRLKIMDQMLNASAKLSVLGEAAASIVHEITNPLATASMLLQSVTDYLNSGNLDKAKEQIQKMGKSLDRISKTVQTIRGFLHKQNQSEFTEVSMKSILDEALALVDQKIQSHHIRLELEISPSLKVKCDPSQLAHVIVNLISNSCDAIERMHEKWIRVEAVEEGADIVIRVIDSGQGIPEEIRELITQPFFTTKARYKGTGLGLSIVKRIVESQGGTMSIDSLFFNTCFIIKIPKIWAKSTA